MEETKAKAIVLGGIDYKEKDKLISLFTLEYGIQTVVFKGVKGVNAKLKSAKEMFSFGDFIYTNGKTKIVISADITESFFDITKDIKKYYTACAMLDIIKTVLPEGERAPGLFISLLKGLKLLTENAVDNYMILNKFLLSVFPYFGYSFNVNTCNNCGETLKINRYMNLSYGDITCAVCRSGAYIELSSSVSSAIRVIAGTDEDKLHTVKIPKETLISLFNVLSANYTHRFNKKIV